jgi:hypothetical protein
LTNHFFSLLYFVAVVNLTILKKGGGLLESLKERVIGFFLDLVARYIPLEEGRFATLGGEGLEAKKWKERNIPDTNGWLIERSPELRGNLILNHRYRNHNQLGTFDKILSGHGESRTLVDAFHLDLCGTLSNKAIANFALVLPLVLKSKGRCLAITVADARRNLVFEQWPRFQLRAKRLFGKEAENIYRKLLDLQKCIPVNKKAPDFIRPFDPEKATKREFGLLIELVELLRPQGFPWFPVAMERYVYVSRYQKRPFRMRTYFFHFGDRNFARPEMAFAEVWTKSKLFFANGDKFEEVMVPAVGTTSITKTGKGEKTMVSKLAEIAKVLGGAELAEYEDLIAKSDKLTLIQTTLDSISGKFAEPSQSSVKSESQEQSSKRGKKKKWEDLQFREQVEWQLKALETKAKDESAWKNGGRERMIEAAFGYCDDELSKSIRSVMAHTSGGFRPKFEARIKGALGNEAKPYLDRLKLL